jgi:predicted AAA+ superfamily ATPase
VDNYYPLSPRFGYNSGLYSRALIPSVEAALADTPVVLVSGARPTGKSTLVRQMGSSSDRQYVTLDDSLTLSAAAADPDALAACTI